MARLIGGCVPPLDSCLRIGVRAPPASSLRLLASPSLREGEDCIFEASPRRFDRVRQVLLVQHRRRRQTVGPPGGV